MIELRRFDSETGKIDILRYWQNSGNLMIKCHYSVRHWYCSQVERSYLTWSPTLIGWCCKMLTPDWSKPSAWGVTQCLWYCYQFILRRDNIGDLFRMFQTSRKLSDSVSNLRECLLLILLIIETFRCLHQQDNESFFFFWRCWKWVAVVHLLLVSASQHWVLAELLSQALLFSADINTSSESRYRQNMYFWIFTFYLFDYKRFYDA